MFKIYVGNISYKTIGRTVEKLFSTYGLVDEVIYVTDDATGEPRGFAFVLMPDENQGRTAITELNGRRVNGRPLAVSEAGERRKQKKQPAPPSDDGGARTQRRVTRGARAGEGSGRRPFRRHRNG